VRIDTGTGALAALLVAATLGGCMGPLVSDEVPAGELVLPAGSTVPEATAATSAQIADNDGVGPLVPLRTGFADGRAIRYWDFGPTTPVAAPIWVIVEDDADGRFDAEGRALEPVGQNNVVDAVPGDPAYGPFWAVILVPVTASWDGEVFASAEAIDAGIAAGLLEPPIPLSWAVNCPIVAAQTRLEVGPDEWEGPDPGYYRGTVIYYYTFGTATLDAAGEVATAPVYELRREGGEPLDEGVRGVDITGDGDHVDSNDLFSAVQGSYGYTGLVTTVDVVVASDYASIDTSGDDTVADLKDAAQLFGDDDEPDPAWVVAFYPSIGTVYNRPVQPAEEE